MLNIIRSLIALAIFASASVAEVVPAPENETARHYIQIPEGGLKEFFKWHPMRVPLVSHHRGGPVLGYPENAIETMDNALKYGPGLMEIDVAELADGTLILMHDYTLDRTTTGSGKVSNQTWETVKGLKLKDELGNTTEYRVPILRDVLLWAKGKTVLTLDIKKGTDFGKVVAAVRETGAADYVAAIAYSVKQAQAFHNIAPDMPISISARSLAEISAIEASGIPSDVVIAWTGTNPLQQSIYNEIHQRGWKVIAGTLGSSADSIDNQIAVSGNDGRYLELYARGVDIIATDRFWAVQGQILNPRLYMFVITKQQRR